MTRSRRIFAISILLLAILLSLHCSQSPTTADTGGGSETVWGKIAYADGTPAEGVTVQLVPTDHSPLAKAKQTATYDSTLTNAAGEYAIHSVDPGEYNVIARKDTLGFFRDSIPVGGNTPLGTNVITPLGGKTGIVGLQSGHDPRTVTVQALGTYTYANVDSNGQFTLYPLAEGTYNLELKSTLPNYTPIYVSTQIHAGIRDTIQDTLKLIYTGIPIVTGLTAHYDTANGLVHLSWNAVGYTYFRQFQIFRDSANALTPSMAPVAICTDTHYVDTIFSATPNSAQFPLTDTSSHAFEYRVRVQNQSQETGASFGFARADAVSPSRVQSHVTFTVRNLTANRDTAASSMNDSLRIIASVMNQGRRNTSINWYLFGSGSVSKSKLLPLPSNGFEDTLTVVYASLGTKTVSVRVTDEAGTLWLDSLQIPVVQDVPVAFAGNDTAVNYGTSLKFHGTGSDQFGSIVKYEWDLDGPGSALGYVATTTGDTTVVLTDSGYAYFRVTDDDGNQAVDTVYYRAPIWLELKKLNTSRSRYGHHFYSPSSGKIYLIGADTSNISSSNDYDGVDVLDPITNTLVSKGSYLSPASNMGICEIDSALYLIGGYTRDALNNKKTDYSVRIYRPFADTWSLGTAMPSASASMAVCPFGNAVYAIVGPLTRKFDIQANTWKTMQYAVPNDAVRAASCVSLGNHIYFFTPKKSFPKTEAAAWIYTPSADNWSLTGSEAPYGVEGYYAALVGSRIYTFGGTYVGVYDPALGQWGKKATIPSGIEEKTAFAISNTIYVVGIVGQSYYLYSYHPATDPNQ